ncbi:MAG: hypothetical protein IKY78_00125 [Clostridia bacterium]|nr:hypothetical protein [Clostridia bacterium]
MKKLKPWQIALLIIFYPVGIVYLIIYFVKKHGNTKITTFSGEHAALNNKTDRINLQNSEILGTDLVEASYSLACCPECAKLRGRVFSTSGKDKRFPIKPKQVDCSCSGITFSPFVFGVSEPIVNDYLNRKVDIIKFSNRPFIDDRTPKEKKDFEEYSKYLEDQKQKELDRIEYENLCSLLPNDAPKSFGAYRKMKKSKTSGFIKIQKLAKKYNLQIE